MGSVKSLRFPLNPLGLALAWLGLAVCGFCETIAFSNESGWFGLGLAVRAFFANHCLHFLLHPLDLGLVWVGAAWFGRLCLLQTHCIFRRIRLVWPRFGLFVFCGFLMFSSETVWFGIAWVWLRYLGILRRRYLGMSDGSESDTCMTASASAPSRRNARAHDTDIQT